MENVVRCYFPGLRVGEAICFIKQSYRLEDIRVLTYQRPRNFVALVLAASYFAAVYVGEGLGLSILVKKLHLAAKRFFGIPPLLLQTGSKLSLHTPRDDCQEPIHTPVSR